MCHIVPGQDREVVRHEILPVPDLDPVAPTSRQSLEKPLQALDKVGHVGEIGRAERAELKHQHGNMGAMRLKHLSESTMEVRGIEKCSFGRPPREP